MVYTEMVKTQHKNQQKASNAQNTLIKLALVVGVARMSMDRASSVEPC